MSGVYERELLLGSEHVDCFRRLRTSTLMELLQTASIRHTEELGMGREKTLDRGLLWVIARQHVIIERWPVYDERIIIRSWPGETMRVLFPRYYEIASAADGSVLVKGSAVWSLMDMETRTTAFPDEYGVEIDGVETGREIPFLTRLTALETTESRDFTVPYSYVDINGHMNNTRYFDLVEDSVGIPAEGRELAELQTEYSAEAPLGSTLRLDWGGQDGRCYVTGCVSGPAEGPAHPCFRMSLQYR